MTTRDQYLHAVELAWSTFHAAADAARSTFDPRQTGRTDAAYAAQKQGVAHLIKAAERARNRALLDAALACNGALAQEPNP
jgi:hypothetical protein